MKTFIALMTVGALFASPALAKGHSVSVGQHSAVNASVVATFGPGTSVGVTQTGVVNGSVVGQFGNFSTATVSQTGKYNASAIGQGY